VLQNLSLRDLACAAATCREFQQEFSGRLDKERVKLMSVGGAGFGKSMFHGFLMAFQQIMLGGDPYPPLRRDGEICVTIDADGRVEIPYHGDFVDMVWSDGPRVHIQKLRGSNASITRLWREGSRGGSLYIIEIDSRTNDQGVVELFVDVDREAAPLAAGLMLAICRGNSMALPASWQCLLNRITVSIDGEKGTTSFAPFLWCITDKE
jgi:hypothetical protein